MKFGVLIDYTILLSYVGDVFYAPDDEWSYHLKHVEQFTNINKLYSVASCWTIIEIYVGNVIFKSIITKYSVRLKFWDYIL
jgi:hypothetical protein